MLKLSMAAALVGGFLLAGSAQGEPMSDNQAKVALAHLYQARDALNAAHGQGALRDRALHNIYAAIDATRTIAYAGNNRDGSHEHGGYGHSDHGDHDRR